jgi:hypothetical protein
MYTKKMSATASPKTHARSFSLTKAIVLYLAVTVILRIYRKTL